MGDFDYATPTASSLDIPGNPRVDAYSKIETTEHGWSMGTKDTITEKLREAFAPQSLDVIDESNLHEGHAGHSGRSETHFRVNIVSGAFAGKSRLERHRMINALLASELSPGGVHALAIKATAPGEG
jgi:BolA family transcriptional regulator, general stress-responsive regulator